MEILKMNQKHFALILAGSGHLDGAEITEAVALNIALSKEGYKVSFFAPDRAQLDTVNHLTKTSEEPNRNILVEAARIARGNISPISELDIQKFDGIAMAGGFGVIKNFTTFLKDGDKATLISDIAIPLHSAINARLPIIAICAAPMALAIALKELNIKDGSITFGAKENAGDFLPALETWNVAHYETAINQAHVDKKYHLITNGAYMNDKASPFEIFLGASACVEAYKTLQL